jgi:subtilisin-like proprotein convertase family protein
MIDSDSMLKRSILKISIALLFINGVAQKSWSQETPISNSTLEACQGFLVDTGLSASDYGPNEDITMTVCPEAPETIITLYFALAAFGEGDIMQIFDGPDDTAPLLGTYEAFDLQGLELYASELNPGGCLTLHFTSDDSGAGNFVAEMSCGYPCERPIAIVDSGEPVPHLVCVGEEITFDGQGSTSADGFDIVSWEWDFDDGTITNDVGVASHAYDAPGAYKVQLFIADNNITDDDPEGCSNNNLIDHLVLVSTEPDWTGTSIDATVCSGQLFPLDGVVQGTTYDSEPSGDFGEGLFIPDDQTQCFNAELTFTGFSSGAVVENANSDIVNFFINFEHSWMGDLTISFICPNGQSLAVHQQGGGSTNLGVPDQGDGTGPGTGWDYFWSPLATNGTWADNATGQLPAGEYESAQPFSILEGCPLNGTWEVEVCDAWGADDGYIFEWNVNFNPELYPEPIVFTPVFGMDCDSTSWEGPNIYDENEDCNEITLVAVESGTYTYTATNNFGCTFSTDVDLTVVQGPEIEIETPAGFCGSPVSLVGNVLNQEPGFNYSYEWSPADLVNGNGANVNVDGLTQDTVMTLLVSVTGGDLDNCEVAQNVEVDFIPPPNGVNASAEVCPDDAVQLVSLNFANEGLSESDFTYDWQFEGETVGTGAVLNAGEPGEYEVLITMAPPCTWTTTSFFDVEEDICELTIPNVISPNGPGQWDALNDAFYVEGLDSDRYNGSTIRIYNRWGQLMYTSNNFGKSSGWKPIPDEAAEGTYYYVLGIARTDSDLIINDVNGQTIDEGEGFKYINGAFTLVR